jgi:hypothetical protein
MTFCGTCARHCGEPLANPPALSPRRACACSRQMQSHASASSVWPWKASQERPIELFSILPHPAEKTSSIVREQHVAVRAAHELDANEIGETRKLHGERTGPDLRQREQGPSGPQRDPAAVRPHDLLGTALPLRVAPDVLRSLGDRERVFCHDKMVVVARIFRGYSPLPTCGTQINSGRGGRRRHLFQSLKWRHAVGRRRQQR